MSLTKGPFHEKQKRSRRCKSAPADFVVDSYRGCLAVGQVHPFAYCCFADDSQHWATAGGNRISAGHVVFVRLYKSADDVESAWVGEGNRFKRSVSLHAQPDLSRHGFHVDRLSSRVWECVGDSACAGVHPVDEQTGDRARRGLLGEKIWGGVHRLQVPCEALVVIRTRVLLSLSQKESV